MTQGQITIISKSDSWKYKDDGSNQGVNWRNTGFNDGGWLQGNAELGYGDAPVTTLQSGKITYYFRKVVNYNFSNFQNLTLKLRRDDGAVIYINGREVFRNNMPTGIILYNTPASSFASDDGSTVLQTILPTTNFINGDNVIAAEIHNNSTSSSDITFELELLGNTSTSLPTITRGAYMVGTSESSINIQWRTNTSCNGEVKYGTVSGNLTNSITHTNLTTDHSITLSNLLPNTKYYYSIGTIGNPIQSGVNHYFYTSPNSNNNSTVSFWVTGDFGNSSSTQRAVRDQFLTYSSNMIINGWLWLGDNAYNSGTDSEYQTKVFNVYGTLFNRLPLYPAPGNHDYANSGYLSSAALGTNFPYFSIFNIPTNSTTEKYYSFNYANIHFISLDSYGSRNNSSSTMYNWLRNDLANNTQTWTIVYFHHAPYSKGSHDSDNSTEMKDMRQNIVPLLEQYGVDLVLSGHSHIYERSKFIKGHYGTESTFSNSVYPAGNVVQNSSNNYTKSSLRGNGTIYVVCGVSGQSGGSTQSGYPHNAMQVSTTSKNGSLVLSVTGGVLNCIFLTSTGTIADDFTITKTTQPVSTYENKETNREKEIVQNGLSVVYPNPSRGVFNLRLNKETKSSEGFVSVFNIVGELVYSEKIYIKEDSEDSDLKVDLSNMPTGIYYLVINFSKENTESFKLLLE